MHRCQDSVNDRKAFGRHLPRHSSSMCWRAAYAWWAWTAVVTSSFPDRTSSRDLLYWEHCLECSRRHCLVLLLNSLYGDSCFPKYDYEMCFVRVSLKSEIVWDEFCVWLSLWWRESDTGHATTKSHSILDNPVLFHSVTTDRQCVVAHVVSLKIRHVKQFYIGTEGNDLSLVNRHSWLEWRKQTTMHKRVD